MKNQLIRYFLYALLILIGFVAGLNIRNSRDVITPAPQWISYPDSIPTHNINCCIIYVHRHYPDNGGFYADHWQIQSYWGEKGWLGIDNQYPGTTSKVMYWMPMPDRPDTTTHYNYGNPPLD